jgi:hypothetical protein
LINENCSVIIKPKKDSKIKSFIQYKKDNNKKVNKNKNIQTKINHKKENQIINQIKIIILTIQKPISIE